MTYQDNFITVNITEYDKVYYKQIGINNNIQIIEKIKKNKLDLDKIDTWFNFEMTTINESFNILVSDYTEICKFKNEVHSDSCKKNFNIVPQQKFIDLCNKLYTENIYKPLDKDIDTLFATPNLDIQLLNIKDENSKIIIFGDYHSSLHSLINNLRNIYNKNYFDENWKLKKNIYIISLGDLVDRGPYSIEILYIMLQLKLNNPNNVILLHGNHETKEIYDGSNGINNVLPVGLTQELKHQFPHIKLRNNIQNIIYQFPICCFAQFNNIIYQMNHGAIPFVMDFYDPKYYEIYLGIICRLKLLIKDKLDELDKLELHSNYILTIEEIIENIQKNEFINIEKGFNLEELRLFLNNLFNNLIWGDFVNEYFHKHNDNTKQKINENITNTGREEVYNEILDLYKLDIKKLKNSFKNKTVLENLEQFIEENNLNEIIDKLKKFGPIISGHQDNDNFTFKHNILMGNDDFLLLKYFKNNDTYPTLYSIDEKYKEINLPFTMKANNYEYINTSSATVSKNLKYNCYLELYNNINYSFNTTNKLFKYKEINTNLKQIDKLYKLKKYMIDYPSKINIYLQFNNILYKTNYKIYTLLNLKPDLKFRVTAYLKKNTNLT